MRLLEIDTRRSEVHAKRRQSRLRRIHVQTSARAGYHRNLRMQFEVKLFKIHLETC